MLETPHVLVGAAIASKVVNPLLAIPLAFGSHFLLERIPHWNPHLNREKDTLGKVSTKTTKIVILDSSLALISGAYIASRALPNTYQAIFILLACLASVLPDLIEAPYFFLNCDSPLIKRWIKLQKAIQADASFAFGVTTQIGIIALSLLWIFT